jgi:hypothetical protein
MAGRVIFTRAGVLEDLSHVFSPAPFSYAQVREDDPGGARGAGPSGLYYPSRPERSRVSLHRTGRMAMLHRLRGRHL